MRFASHMLLFDVKRLPVKCVLYFLVIYDVKLI